MKMRLGVTLFDGNLTAFLYVNPYELAQEHHHWHKKNREASIKTFIQRPGNQAHNCKMVYEEV